MVKAIEPNAPIGASRMIQRISVKSTVENFSIPRAMLRPASPLACRPKPNSTETRSTGKMSLPVKALTSVAGIIARTNSTKPSCSVAAGGRPLVESDATSMCSPLPGLTMLTTTRPITMAMVVKTSK